MELSPGHLTESKRVGDFLKLGSLVRYWAGASLVGRVVALVFSGKFSELKYVEMEDGRRIPIESIEAIILEGKNPMVPCSE